MRIAVIGSGISGLTCGVALAEAGHHVEIWTRDPPEETVSSVAGAVWYPLRSERDDRTERWARASLAWFTALSRVPGTGIILRSGIDLLRSNVDDTPWRDQLPGFRHASPAELPEGFVDGWVAGPLPVIEMPVYLSYLRRRFRVRGRVLVRAVTSFDEVDADVVVNCAGLGARSLAGDSSVVPIRGQVVRVEQFGLDRFIFDEANPDGVVYIIPRARDVVLGGVREEGVAESRVDRATARTIVERCARLEPRVRDARIVSHAAGLRPGRPSVRVEREGRVVHDYGHGGSGVTLSWGCALEVAELVARG